MKKRLAALALSLSLLLTLTSPALAGGVVTSGTYWTDLTWDEAADMIDAARAGDSEPFLILYYSHLCGYTQTYLPQFKDYAEANGIRVYSLDAIADAGGPVSTRALNLGFTPHGGYPMAFRYLGSGDALELTSDIRSMDAFTALLGPTPEPTGDFLINESGVLVDYLGSQADVVTPAGVTAIGPSAFSGCESLRSVTVSEGVTSIGMLAFQNCPNLIQVSFPGTLTAMEPFPFSPGAPLEELDMEKSGLTALDEGLCANMRRLRRVTLPHGLVSIGKNVFTGCSSLTGLTLPATVTSIGKNAFNTCLNLQTVRFLGSRPDMPTGADSPFAWARGAGIYPVSDPSWGDAQTLSAQHAGLNWGGLPGQTAPVPDRSAIDDGTLADWAAEEVAQAISYGLSYEALQKDYDQPISRISFSLLLMSLIEKQTGRGAAVVYEDHGSKSPFTDVENIYPVAASFLGLVNGRGDGRFDPEGTITRQEAAAMLSRAAQFLGLPVTESDRSFSDAGEIAAWAAADVGFVSSLSSPQGRPVMGGTGGGFSPLATYSRQEAICSFLRLYFATAST